MCFHSGIRSNKKPTPKIAKEDIICWKILRRNYTPAVFSLLINQKAEPYQKEFIYLSKLDVQKTWFNEWVVYAGFHSYKSLTDRLVSNANRRKVKMIIPKGAKYYENDSQYVSNKIRRA